MKTSNLKRIVIAILALVNVFLLALLISRGVQERAARVRAVTQLIQLYHANGVELPASLVPTREARLAPIEPARDLEAEAAFAEAILGTCAPEDAGGGIYRYVSDSGTCLIRASGMVEITLDRPIADPEAFLESLFTAYGYAPISSDLQNGDGTIVAARVLPDGAIFNAGLELRFFRGRLLSVTGSFVPAVEASAGGSGVDGITALVRFLDYSNNSGEVCTAVTGVRSGYLLQSTAFASQRLIPAWCVTTDVNDYYINMMNGEVSRGP